MKDVFEIAERKTIAKHMIRTDIVMQMVLRTSYGQATIVNMTPKNIREIY